MVPKDIEIGQKFGRWTVLSKTKKRLANHSTTTICLCECECGQQLERQAWNLLSGANIGCPSCRAKHHRGENHPNWKGFEVVRGDHGYVRVRNAEYPGATFPNRTYEHIVVMSRILGRPLLAQENVHHKNGVRNDNRPENLELWITQQPTGQRSEDLIEWATEILQRYAPTRLSTT